MNSPAHFRKAFQNGKTAAYDATVFFLSRLSVLSQAVTVIHKRYPCAFVFLYIGIESCRIGL